jgi:formamidopyrimidine-DNA glycosylase
VPELPEVETYRRALEPRLTGRVIRRALIRDERLTRPVDPGKVTRALEGQQITAVDRRGKYLLVRCASGTVLLIHLRMTGGFPLGPASHERAVIELDDGALLRYRDVRRFGTWLVLDAAELGQYLDTRLGPEPLETAFTRAFLVARLAERTAPVKAAILDQRTVAGLGNIYADEGLWHAQIHPLRPAGQLDVREIERLRSGVRIALQRGIDRHGADLGDGAYRGGAMQDEFVVYGRAGEPCLRCGTPIEKSRVGGRGTWFCPGCQRRAAR